jgi:hypothetical protein
VHREDELLQIERTQSGARNQARNQTPSRTCKSSARNEEHAIRRAIRRHHAPASRASRRRPRH